MSRKPTPDILGTLMGEEVKTNRDAPKERNKTIKQASNKAIKPAQAHFNGMEPSQEEQQPLKFLKEKATFNLSKAVLEDLEDCWMQIRKLRGDKQISKTDIVEQALEDAIKDFKLKREIGKFYGKLESNKTIKQ